MTHQCFTLRGEKILLVAVLYPAGSGSTVNDCSVLHVLVLTEQDASLIWQGRNVAANHKQPAMQP